MSKTRKWYAKGLCIVFALALLVGLSVTPVSASTVGTVTVTVEPNTQNLVAQYTINFNTSGGGALAISDTITFTSVDGTIPADQSWDTGDVTVNGTMVTRANVVRVSGTSITVKTPVEVAASSSVEIIFKAAFGMKNPTAGPYSLIVATTGDTGTKTSKEYIIAGATGLPVKLYTDKGVFVDSYSTIAEALAADAANYTITVEPGTYAPSAFLHINVDGLTLNSTDGAATTIIDASALSPSGIYGAIYVNAADVTVDGFTIKDSGDWGIGFSPSSSGGTIKNSIITNNALIAINLSGSTHVVDNNTIEDSYCIYLNSGTSSHAIKNNTITGNTASTEGAISFVGSNDSITISGNTITGGAGSGIYWFASAAVCDKTVIERNTISGNADHGIEMATTNAPTKMLISGNTITDNTDVGIYIASWDDGTTTRANVDIIKFNNIYGNDTTNGYGLQNATALAVDAKHNWWGTTSRTAIAAMIYDSSSGTTSYETWLGTSVSSGAYTLNKAALNCQSTVGVWVTSSENADIGVAKYTGNPQATPEFSALGYFDVYATTEDDAAWGGTTLVTIKLYDAAVTSSSEVYFWSDTENEWVECHDAGPSSGYAWVNVRAFATDHPDRVPMLTDLVKLPFAIGTPRVLESIEATPDPVAVDVAGTQQLTVTATYSDLTTEVVTTSVDCTYVSDTPTVATVTSPGGGLITGVAAGSATITVSYSEAGVTAEDTTVSVTVAGPADQLDDADIADETDMVYYFDNATKLWSYYAPGVPTSDLVTLITGSPCWIYVSADCTTTNGTVLYEGWNLITWAG